MKKVYGFYMTLIFVAFFSLVGCKANEENGFRFYDNGAAYTVGEFTCASVDVNRVEIDWLGGNVEIEQSSSDKVSVFEEENELADEKRLHTYLSDGVLRIKYCRSGCRGKIDEMQKNLQVDIPKGVDVKINGMSVNVYLGILETGDISVETDTGCIEAERIVCRRADLETERGYIGVGALTADAVKIDGGAGEIHVGIPDCPNTEIETDRGDVTLYLQGDVSALIEFETQTGTLKTERPYEKTGAKYLFVVDGIQSNIRRLSVETDGGNLRVQ